MVLCYALFIRQQVHQIFICNHICDAIVSLIQEQQMVGCSWWKVEIFRSNRCDTAGVLFWEGKDILFGRVFLRNTCQGKFWVPFSYNVASCSEPNYQSDYRQHSLCWPNLGCSPTGPQSAQVLPLVHLGSCRFCKHSDDNKRQRVATILDKLITLTIEEVEVSCAQMSVFVSPDA